MKRYWLLFVMLALMVTACQQATVQPTAATTNAPTMTATPTQTATMTLTPTSTRWPTRTPTITLTPTVTPIVIGAGGNPVGLGQQLAEVELINLDNIHRLEEIGRWGYGTLYDVKLSPDESQVVAAASTGVLWLNADTLEEERFVPYQQGCNSLTVELSYSTEMAACIDRDLVSLFLINTADGTIFDQLTQENLADLWFFPDDTGLIVAAGEFSYTWSFHNQQWSAFVIDNLEDIVFSQDGTSYVSLGHHQELIYYSKDSEKVALSETIDFEWYWDGGFGSIDLSHDGRLLALGNGWEQSVLVWDIEQEQPVFYQCVDPYGCWQPEEDGSGTNLSGKLSRPFLNGGPRTWISEVHLSPDNQYLLFEAGRGYEASKLFVYHLETETLVKIEEKTEGEIITFSENDRYLQWSNDISLYGYSLSGAITTTIPAFNFSTAAISPDSELIARYAYDRILLHDINSGEMIYSYEFPSVVSGLDFFHTDNKLLVTLSGDFQDIHIWNYKTNHIQRISEEPQDDWYPQWYRQAMLPSVSFDDRLIFFQIFDNLGYLYDLVQNTYQNMGYSVWYAFHPTKNQAMGPDWGDEFETISISVGDGLDWEVDTPVFDECRVPNHNYEESWGYLPSGSGFFCSIKGKLVVYDNDGNAVHTLMGWNPIPGPELWGPNTLPMLPDDSIIFGYEQNQIYVFDLVAEQKIATFFSPAEIDSVLVSPDGNYVLVYGVDGVTHIYGVPVDGND